jgi:hypothetical protein
VPGFPIRTPWDHSLVDSSPRPIAASHVLHRLLVPRHPPFALDNLTTKMLASTVQFSTNDQPTTPSDNTNTGPRPLPRTIQPVCCRGRAWRKNNQPQDRGHPPPQSQKRVVLSGLNRVLIIDHPAAPAAPFPPTPRRGPAVLGRSGRCQKSTRQCLRHMSTPPPHPGGAGY